MNTKEELFEVVDEENNIVGFATRRECHGNPSLIHCVAHVLVFDSSGRLILQKRSPNKDIQPGKWDTSVGGHMDIGETPEETARREMKEELGIEGVSLQFIYQYFMRNEVESESVFTYYCRYDGEVNFDHVEITEVKKWRISEVNAALGTGVLTPNFEEEFRYFMKNCDDSQ